MLLQSLRSAADAVASLRALQGQSHSTEAAEARAQSAYALARQRYEGGLADYDSVLISESILLVARDDAASLHFRGFQLDIALAEALGGGFSGFTPDQRASQ